MSQRRLQLFAFTSAILASVGGALALAPRSAPAAQAAPATSAHPARTPSPVAAPLPLASPAREPTRFERLPPLHLVNQMTGESLDVRLYDANGNIDEVAARQLDELLCDAREPKQRDVTTMQRRTLQLLFKAAYHFESAQVQVVSAYRKPGRRREGPHGTGSAIDFRLSGVKAAELAAYLRKLPRTGVGIYTHPKTQFVHLDSRDHSFHWLDASPPRRHWRERSLGERDLQKRDEQYSAEQDLP